MGVKYFPRASGRKQNWDSYHQHTSTTCWVNLRRLKEWEEWSLVVLWEKITMITVTSFSFLFVREGRMLPPRWTQLNVTPRVARTLGCSMGWEDPTEGFWAWIILPVLHLRRLPTQRATAVKWTPVVQWWVLRKRLNYSHVAHIGDHATEEASWDTSTELKILMPATQIASTIHLVSQRNSIANKRCLKSRRVCFIPTSIPPLFYHWRSPSKYLKGKGELWISFEVLNGLESYGICSRRP